MSHVTQGTCSASQVMVAVSHKVHVVQVGGGGRVTQSTHSASQGVLAVLHKLHLVQVKGL